MTKEKLVEKVMEEVRGLPDIIYERMDLTEAIRKCEQQDYIVRWCYDRILRGEEQISFYDEALM